MVQKKEDRRVVRTKKAIRSSFAELLSEKDYGNITVSDICRTAEISRGTFYLHYSNIPAVLDELLEDALNVSGASYPFSAKTPIVLFEFNRDYRCFFDYRQQLRIALSCIDIELHPALEVSVSKELLAELLIQLFSLRELVSGVKAVVPHAAQHLI